MVDRPGHSQTSFNSGEIDLQAGARAELKAWHSAVAHNSRIEAIPQGGFDLAPSTSDVGAVRFAMPVLATATPGAASLATGAVIAAIDLGAAVAVAGVWLGGLTASVAGSVTIEVGDGATFVPLPAASANATPRDRRQTAEPGKPLTGRHVRLTWTGAAATVTLATLQVLGEDLTASTRVRVRAFNLSPRQAYQMVLTPAGADFWSGGTYRGGCRLPYTAEQFDGLGHPTQRYDTALLWHRDVAPQRILRLADHDWQVGPAPFERWPLVDYGGDYAKVSEVWRLYLRYSSSTGGVDLALTVTVNSEESATVETGETAPVWADVAAALSAAIEALPSVGAGVVVTHEARSGVTEFTVTFGGANAGSTFGVSGRVTNSTDAAMTASRITQGDSGGEAIASEARGWPVTGRFYQDRLLLGGFRSEPGAVLASATGEYYTLDVKIEAASGAILWRRDTEQAEETHTLMAARHLVMATTTGLAYVSDRQLTRTSPPNVVDSGGQGASPKVPILAIDNELYYASEDGSVIYAARYDDVGQVYSSDPVSLLASPLVKDVVDAAWQRGNSATDATRYLLVRADGVMLNALLMRGQDIAGFTRWPTDGKVRSVAVDSSNTGWLAVERRIAGVARVRLERWVPGQLLDAAVGVTRSEPETEVTGLEPLEGATVWAVADGWVFGPFVVAGGGIELPVPARDVLVGRWTPPRLVTLPLVRDVSDDMRLRRPVRVHTVKLHSTGTTSLAVGANGRPARPVVLYRAGMAADQPLAPVVGDITVTGLTGFSPDGQVEITQVAPGELKIRDIITTAKV